jgi:hypothetical protein
MSTPPTPTSAQPGPQLVQVVGERSPSANRWIWIIGIVLLMLGIIAWSLSQG